LEAQHPQDTIPGAKICWVESGGFVRDFYGNRGHPLVALKHVLRKLDARHIGEHSSSCRTFALWKSSGLRSRPPSAMQDQNRPGREYFPFSQLIVKHGGMGRTLDDASRRVLTVVVRLGHSVHWSIVEVLAISACVNSCDNDHSLVRWRSPVRDKELLAIRYRRVRDLFGDTSPKLVERIIFREQAQTSPWFSASARSAFRAPVLFHFSASR